MQVKRKYIYGAGAACFTLALVAYLSREKIYKHFDYKTKFLLQTLDPGFRKKVERFLSRAAKEGIELRVTSANRTCREQDELYAQGRTKPGKIVTNAICGKSSHNYHKAVDVVEFAGGKPLWENPRWEHIGRLGEKEGLEWGGRWRSFKDRPHFQDLGGRTIAQLYRDFQRTGRLVA
ncbi:M15 family metallopeptidase [Fulvivirga ulvae]|uniref:M15 family metallopeptidase n=1 Tax=Fulvivirga ulvae TaxID=2904245 RepID=UPI001F1DA82C|nr:M15 family metallopeptidase [Fulvivirga ulvae]UII32164.1 M15 family metallopeptidase [Fulvivirga ulvae]